MLLSLNKNHLGIVPPWKPRRQAALKEMASRRRLRPWKPPAAWRCPAPWVDFMEQGAPKMPQEFLGFRKSLVNFKAILSHKSHDLLGKNPLFPDRRMGNQCTLKMYYIKKPAHFSEEHGPWGFNWFQLGKWRILEGPFLHDSSLCAGFQPTMNQRYPCWQNFANEGGQSTKMGGFAGRLIGACDRLLIIFHHFTWILNKVQQGCLVDITT